MLRISRTDIVFIFFAVMQFCLWRATRDIHPDVAIVPPVPSELTVKAVSFGDEQFYFRALALEIQNAGDMYGNVTPLKDYDYKKLASWFFLLDTLDSKSNFVPAVASYYYGQTQHIADLTYIVDYLEAHASLHPADKWWWLAQAVYIANHRLGDKHRALLLANKLARTPDKDVPIWVRQMPAFIHAELGEKEEALFIIKHVLDNEKNISQDEYKFMQYFINERLDYIIKDSKKHK